MASGTSLGTAYVQIVPSAQGIKGNIEKELKGGEEAGSKFGSALVGKLKSVIAAAGIGIALKNAINEGAALEQSMGGVETLYGEAAGAVKNYANEAAKAGISANNYAEQAVTFGASLKQAFGGDTTKSMEAANTAILDMADNAAKMGTPLESIQNAYQGFAKQNYTMLDNLKLGYGGTKSEMERLLADATKLSGVEYDISNLGDVYDAIHVIQTDLGLTGVAASEAATTISGSANAMKVAFQNVMAYLVTGDQAGLQGAMTQFVQSACNFLFNNLIPAIGNIIAQLPGAIGTFITTAAPLVLQHGKTLINNIINGFKQNGPKLLSSMSELLLKLASTIATNLPNILEKGREIVTKIVAGLQEKLPVLGAKAGELIGKIASTIAANLPTILQKGGELVTKLIAGIVKMIPTLLKTAVNMVKNIGTQIRQVDWATVGKNILQGIAKGIVNGGSVIINAAKEAAKKALEAAKNFLGIHSPSRVFRDQVGQMIGEGMALGIEDSTSVVNGAMRDISKSSLGTIGTDLSIRPAMPVKANQTEDLISALAPLMAYRGGNETQNINLVVDGQTLAKVVYNPLNGLILQGGVVNAR